MLKVLVLDAATNQQFVSVWIHLRIDNVAVAI